MNYIDLFYKEANMKKNADFVSAVSNFGQELSGVGSAIKSIIQPSGDPNSAAWVEEKVTKNPATGETISVEKDNIVNLNKATLSKEFSNLIKEVGNDITPETIKGSLEYINSLNGLGELLVLLKKFLSTADPDQLKDDDLSKVKEMVDAMNLEETEKHRHILANTLPAVKRMVQIFLHEVKGHMDSGEGEHLKDEAYAQEKDKDAPMVAKQKIDSMYSQVDANLLKIKEVNQALESLTPMLEGLKNSTDAMAARDQILNLKDHGISVKSSIINRDLESLVKIANVLDYYGFPNQVDFIDSVIENIVIGK